MARDDMKKILDQLSIENVSDQRVMMNHYFDLLENLILVKDPFLNDDDDEVQEIIQDDSKGDLLPTKPNIFRVDRKLRGGYIPELNQFIPEGIIRNLNLDNGDLVRVESVPYSMDRYNFYFEKKGEGIPAPGRVQINYCLVEKDGDLLVVNQSFENGKQNIRIGELPFTFIVKDEDRRFFELQENDLIDIAYYDGKPETMKVIWQHQLDDSNNSPAKSGIYKSKIKGIESLVLKTLQDKKILVVGCEPRKAIFQKTIEDRGGTFLWSEVADEALIRKADIIIILIRFIRHQTSIDTVRIAKEHQKAFTTMDTLGVQSLIDAAEGLLVR